MITRAFLRSLNFRVFSRNDYFGFAGVESPVPLIAESDDQLVVLDGVYCEVYASGLDGTFEQVATCSDVTKLPA